MDRRDFLRTGSAAGLVLAVAGRPLAASLAGPARSVATGKAYEPVAAFPSGILSGDPDADGVVLWTRIDPAVAGGGIDVAWEVASDPGFAPATLLASGSASTDPATDHTVRATVVGLGAGTTCWYRFTVAGTASPTGRTKTLPVGSVDRVRLAYFSCQRYVHGYYNAHADLAALALDPATDVDLVICLGDYVYEAGPADGVTVAGRVDPAAPQVTLADFRRQYHRYRSDLDLQAMHAAFPFVGIFDNHDGLSDPTDPSGPGAIAAFFEQMPVRRSTTEPNRQHRSFALGDLAEVFLLDERQHRDPRPPESDHPLGTSSVEEPSMVDPSRTMLGADQKAWLTGGLSATPAAWKVLGSQLMFLPLRSQRFDDVQATAGDGVQRNAGRFVNLTQWDGYQGERRELVEHFHREGIEDVVVLSGDSHFWTAAELPLDHDDPRSPYVLTEFGGSSVTSANADEMDLPGNEVIRPVLAAANPWFFRYIDVSAHGYGLVDLTPERATVTFRATATITETSTEVGVLARFEVDRGTARVRLVEGGEGFLARPEVPTETPTTAPPGSGPAVDDPGPAVPVAGAPAYAG